MSKKETLHIYIRCSTDKQIDNSVERQKKLGLEYSKKMNMKSKLWIDGGKSRFGGLDKRDKISELITEVQFGDVNHIWVEDWSRLTGEVEGTLEIEMYVLNGDVKVYEGLRGNMEYRPDNVMERSFQYLKTMMGSQVKKDEIKKSIQTKIDLFQKGYYMKGDPPFGFKLVDRKLVVDNNESKWVKKIFKWYVNDKLSISQIQKNLKLSGVRTKRSKKRDFGVENIRIILTNKNYIGMDSYTDKTKDPHRNNQKRYPFEDSSRWVIYQNKCPRIISDDLFDKVKGLMNKGKTRLTKRDYLLHGKLHCGCGQEWVGRWYHKYDRPFYHCKNNERRYYRNTPNRQHLYQENCNKPKRINGEMLDDYVWNNLLRTLRKSSWIKERVKRELLGEKYGISSIRKSLNRDMKRVIKEIKVFEKNRVDFIRDRYLNKLTNMDYEEIITSIDRKIKELKRELDKLENKEILMDKRTEWIEWLEQHHKNVDDYWTITELRERRRVIDYFIDNITLGYDDITQQHSINIHYKYPIVRDGLIRKGGKLNWDEWGNGYKVKSGDRVYSLSSSNFFLTKENYQILFHSYTFSKVSWLVNFAPSQNS